VADVSLTTRKETRIPLKLFVNLYSPETHTFEVGMTNDVSCHGAQIVTRKFWEPNLPISIRSIRGDFYSRGRVVHCQRHLGTFLVGLEMYYPEGSWSTPTSFQPDA
jgi:hypothetical protein